MIFKIKKVSVESDKGSSLNYVRLFWGGGGPEFLTFSYKGVEESQVASYVIFFNLIFNKYKFYH